MFDRVGVRQAVTNGHRIARCAKSLTASGRLRVGIPSTDSSQLLSTRSAASLAPSTSAVGRTLETLSLHLTSTQPCFGTRGDEVEVLTSPQQFYATLLGLIKKARKRILISTLYIGVEQAELVDAIATALAANPQLRVTFLLDYNRSTRLSPTTPPSTARLLLPLVERFGDRCEVGLFRSPKLRGLLERIVPPRFNEGWGTWHAKWYAVDNEVIISGANLAQSYFSNRQDRYLHIRSHPTFLSYISSFSRLVESYSYRLLPSTPGSASRHYLVPLRALDPTAPSASPLTSAALIWPVASVHPRAFGAHAHATITAFQRAWAASNAARARRVDVDTWFWPVVQSGVLDVREEERAMLAVLRAAGDGKTRVDLTSGYFGLYKAYKAALLAADIDVGIVAAAPKANGFYGSSGISRLIPEGYTLLERRFHAAAKRANPRIRLKEWEREGWTYHAKGESAAGRHDVPRLTTGVWLSPPNEHPLLTFVGSSNLSTRSLKLDTELSLVLSTTSPALRRALAAEVSAIDAHAHEVGDETWRLPERKVSLLARVLVALGVEGML